MDIHVRDIRAGNWHWAENAILDQYGAQLGPYGLAVYYCLCRFASQASETHVSQERIAERIGCSVRQVKREVIKLRDAGLIQVDEHKDARGMNSAATYTLVGLVAGRATPSPRDARESTARGLARHPLLMDKNSMNKNGRHPAQDDGLHFPHPNWEAKAITGLEDDAAQ